jgi:hypothetical protein
MIDYQYIYILPSLYNLSCCSLIFHRTAFYCTITNKGGMDETADDGR